MLCEDCQVTMHQCQERVACPCQKQEVEVGEYAEVTTEYWSC